MNIIPPSFEDWPVLLEINYILSIVFLTLAISLLFTVLYMRIRKNLKDQRKAELEELLIEFINNFLFDEDFNKSEGLERFKNTHLKKDFDIKIAIKQVLLFNENLKGESSSLITELFYGLGLYDILFEDLKTGAWYKKARAIFIFNKLDIKVPEALIEAQLFAKREEARHQAMMYLINNSEKEPLLFFDKLDMPLSLLQQLGIENELKTYEGTMPNFSKWLKHKQSSIVVFCIKMTVDHNQFENILYLQKLINHKEVEVRRQAISSLVKMEVAEVIPLLIKNFSKEEEIVKKDILQAILKIGNEGHLQKIAPLIKVKERMLKVDYLKISRIFNPKIPKNEKEYGTVEPIVKYS